jgi:LmbE family N-acetylglucosaminyl deacetylase
MSADSSTMLPADDAVFLSSHHDDAVLSCGHVIAAMPGSHVVTIFSSGPTRVDPLPEWDRTCGCFTPGDNVAAIRQQEDDAALAVLGAHGSGLGFWPAQYRTTPATARARARTWMASISRRSVSNSGLERDIVERLTASPPHISATTWLVPLGVGHPDHGLTTRAALTLAHSFPNRRWIAYEDLPYARENSGELRAACQRIETAGFRLEPTTLTGHDDSLLKQRAMACYRSQLPGLGGRLEVALTGPERYYELVNSGA